MSCRLSGPAGVIPAHQPMGGARTHTLTDRELHEQWTVPRMTRQAELMGVKVEVSPWREDGVITVKVVGQDVSPPLRPS